MPEETVVAEVANEEVLAAPSTTEEGETNTGESATTEEEQAAQLEAKAKEHKGGVQKRIDKLTAKATALEQEKEFWRGEALKTKSEPKSEVKLPAAPDAKPREEDFETGTAYIEALTDWKYDQRRKAENVETQAAELKKQQKSQQDAFQAKQVEFRKVQPDYDDVMVDSEAPISPAMGHEIIDSAHSAAILYFLAKNPDEAEKLSQLTSPTAVARAIGRIEARLPSGNAEAKPKPITGAPAPITPSGKASSGSTRTPDEMTPSEYRAWRIKQNPNFDV